MPRDPTLPVTSTYRPLTSVAVATAAVQPPRSSTVAEVSVTRVSRTRKLAGLSAVAADQSDSVPTSSAEPVVATASIETACQRSASLLRSATTRACSPSAGSSVAGFSTVAASTSIVMPSIVRLRPLQPAIRPARSMRDPAATSVEAASTCMREARSTSVAASKSAGGACSVSI